MEYITLTGAGILLALELGLYALIRIIGGKHNDTDKK